MMTTSTSVKTVSKVVLQSSHAPISNLKLQKLLYYIQGWSLGLHGKPAFYERVEAWVHGPVVPTAFHAYRHYRWNPIEKPSEQVVLSDAEISHIQMVIKVYGEFSATQLEGFTHDEAPWIEARRDLDPAAPSRVEISKESMRAFFTQPNA